MLGVGDCKISEWRWSSAVCMRMEGEGSMKSMFQERMRKVGLVGVEDAGVEASSHDCLEALYEK